MNSLFQKENSVIMPSVQLNDGEEDEFFQQPPQPVAFTPIHVQVLDPVNEGEGRHMFTSYLIETSTNNSVRRRYSDFLWLSKRLHIELPGAIVPVIPHKRALVGDAKFSPQLIEERRQHLQHFLKEVMAHSELANAPSVTPFMTKPLGEDFDVAKRIIESASPDQHAATDADEIQQYEEKEKPSVGNKIGSLFAKANTMLQVRSGHVELEQTKEDPEINVISEYVAELEQHVKYLVIAAHDLAKSTKDRANGIHILGVHVGAWSTTHQNNVKNSQDAQLKMMRSVIQLSDACHGVLNSQYKAEKSQLEQKMIQLQLDIQAFQNTLAKRRAWQLKYTTKQRIVHEKEALIIKAKKLQRGEHVMKQMYNELEELKKDSKATREILDSCSVRVIRESSRVQPLLTKSLQVCLLSFAKIQISYNEQIKDMWVSVLPRLDGTAAAKEEEEEENEEIEENKTA